MHIVGNAPIICLSFLYSNDQSPLFKLITHSKNLLYSLPQDTLLLPSFLGLVMTHQLFIIQIHGQRRIVQDGQQVTIHILHLAGVVL